MNDVCSRCQQRSANMMKVETEVGNYIYCTACLKKAQELLSMKISPTKAERKLLKSIRGFLKTTKN